MCGCPSGIQCILYLDQLRFQFILQVLCIIHMTQYTAYLKKYVVIWGDKKWIGTSHPLRI